MPSLEKLRTLFARSLAQAPGVDYETLLDCLGFDRYQDPELIEEVEIQIKYQGYIKRQMQQIGRFKKFETRAIPISFPV